MSQLRDPNPPRWDFLAGLLPYGIEPTDIDLSIERHGEFLVMEGKRPGEATPRGQERYLDALAKRPEFTVIRFEGQPPDIVSSYELWKNGGPRPTSTAGLCAVVREWFDWVERRAA